MGVTKEEVARILDSQRERAIQEILSLHAKFEQKGNPQSLEAIARNIQGIGERSMYYMAEHEWVPCSCELQKDGTFAPKQVHALALATNRPWTTA